MRRKRLPPDNRLDWRDPNMPVLLTLRNDRTGEITLEPFAPEVVQQLARNELQDPLNNKINWRNDPTYNLRRRKPMSDVYTIVLLDGDEDDLERSSIELVKNNDELSLRVIEHDDDTVALCNQKQFEELVRNARRIMGWQAPATGHVAEVASLEELTRFQLGYSGCGTDALIKGLTDRYFVIPKTR